MKCLHDSDDDESMSRCLHDVDELTMCRCTECLHDDDELKYRMSS